MIKIKGLSFKKQIRTGMYSSFEPDLTDIKFNKKVIGHISQSRLSSDFKVSLAVVKEKTESDPAGFRWIVFKKAFSKEPEAREFIASNWNIINERYRLYSLDH
jgi:hypothetical protein